MFSSILVAIDGSDTARKALDIACAMATSFEADLHLVHSPQLETTLLTVGDAVVMPAVSPERIAAAGRDVMQAALAQAIEAGCTPAGTTIGDGDAADDILAAAKLNDVDLIVMGRRGLGSLASLFLGSVSQKVGHGATCSLLTVHG